MPDSELDLLPCAVLKVDSNRNVTFGNRYTLDLYCCEPGYDITGCKIDTLFSVASGIFLDSYVYPMLLSDSKIEEVQLSLKALNGDLIPIVANVRLTSEKNSCWTFTSCVNRDLLYDELLAIRDTLQKQAQHLADLNDESRLRQSDLEAFCHSLSHDFSGPLRNIKSLIQIVLEDHFQGTGGQSQACELLEKADQSTDTLISLTKGLIDYLVADVAVAQYELVNLEELMCSVLALFDGPDSIIPNVNMVAMPAIYGNKAQLQVLFKNIFDNSIKYNEQYPEISIGCITDANHQVVISVKDNGIGIPACHLEKIFLPFARLNKSGQYTGSGLGLSIVKKMVNNHQGDIRVESTVGKGSTFYVSLPLRSP